MISPTPLDNLLAAHWRVDSALMLIQEAQAASTDPAKFTIMVSQAKALAHMLADAIDAIKHSQGTKP